MNNVVQFPKAPEWATQVDAKLLARLVATGYLEHRQRHDWRAVEMAVTNAFYAAMFDPRPELSVGEVTEGMLLRECRCGRFDMCSGCADAVAPEQLELP
jgi:hypothetical protein